LEESQVHGVGLHEPDADKLVHQVPDFWIATNNLLVKTFAVHSRDAPEDHQHRFASLARLLSRFGQVVVDPAPHRGNLFAIILDLGIAIFGGVHRYGRKEQAGQDSRKD